MKVNYKRDIEAMFYINFPNCNITNLTNYPRVWRHCCGRGGLRVMKPLQYKYYNMVVHYIYCGYCNQITYYIGR